MTQYHINKYGEVEVCNDNNCKLSESSHYDDKGVAMKVALFVKERLREEDKSNPSLRIGFAPYLKDNHNIYDFYKEKRGIARLGVSKLELRKVDIEILLERMKQDKTVTQGDKEKVKENLVYVDSKLRIARSKEDEANREARKAEKLKKHGGRYVINDG